MSQFIAVIGLESHDGRAVIFGGNGTSHHAGRKRKQRAASSARAHIDVVYVSTGALTAASTMRVDLTPTRQPL